MIDKMRLWHTDLIPVLPRQQLLGQWRELNSIFKNQNKHVLINFVYDYSHNDFFNYCRIIINEMRQRRYRINLTNFDEYFFKHTNIATNMHYMANPFAQKMTDRYLRQCYYNLQEKFDCGAITAEEWKKIEEVCKGRW